MAKNPVFTIGHSTHPAREFAQLVASQGIELIVDVRRFPSSRRYPHFARVNLERDLGTHAGADYLHLPHLGGRRTPRADSPNLGLVSPQFRGYADHMLTDEFREACAQLLKLADHHRLAVMCAEGDWRRCHRQLLADALLVSGAVVLHILPDGRLERHRLSPLARFDGTRLSYPGATLPNIR